MIVGAELTVEPEGSVALLASDHDGYEHLCDLLTAAHADHEKGTAGVLAASASPRRHRGSSPSSPSTPGAPHPPGSLFGPLREAFADRLFVATWRHLDGFDAARTPRPRAPPRPASAP